MILKKHLVLSMLKTAKRRYWNFIHSFIHSYSTFISGFLINIKFKWTEIICGRIIIVSTLTFD